MKKPRASIYVVRYYSHSQMFGLEKIELLYFNKRIAEKHCKVLDGVLTRWEFAEQIVLSKRKRATKKGEK